MTEARVKTYSDFVLPLSVVTMVDLSRLVSEIERVDEAMTEAAVRAKVGTKKQVDISMSDQLSEFLHDNKLEFATGHQRTEVIKTVHTLKDKVPIIHMTFAVEADRESLQKLAQWLRASVHKQAVIGVGIQPALVAGVYVRTPNHVHDFSLRAMIDSQHPVLVKELEALHVSQ